MYIESQRRCRVANDNRIDFGHRGVMNLVPCQLDPTLPALRQSPARILIADSVSLGRKLQTGVLAIGIVQRGRGERNMVVTQ